MAKNKYPAQRARAVSLRDLDGGVQRQIRETTAQLQSRLNSQEDKGVNLGNRQRALQALEMRKAGISWEKIAELLRYRNAANAYQAVHNLLDEVTFEAAREYVQIEHLRLEYMMQRVWPQVIEGQHRAIELALSIHDRAMRLLGVRGPDVNFIQVNQQNQYNQFSTPEQAYAASAWFGGTEDLGRVLPPDAQNAGQGKSEEN